ncbi:MAG: hypothetical protein ACO37F_01520 [Pirellulales bacterium]
MEAGGGSDRTGVQGDRASREIRWLWGWRKSRRTVEDTPKAPQAFADPRASSNFTRPDATR